MRAAKRAAMLTKGLGAMLATRLGVILKAGFGAMLATGIDATLATGFGSTMHKSARVCLSCLCALVLAASMIPGQAWAYYDRGSVSVSLGASSLEVSAGSASSVTVSISPMSDDQTAGCGMPKCPQGCADSCADANGQCQCGGSEYTTYYATAVASSSDTSVAVAVYSSGTLTVYGKSEGDAVITVRASLRQFTDGEASISVHVSGSADASSGSSNANVVIPDEATEELSDDRLDFVEKTVMGRPVQQVRIIDELDAAAYLRGMAGTDGDVIFWSGDTFYHPDYSLTFTGTNYSEADIDAALSAEGELDVSLSVSTKAEGVLYQLLAELDSFVIVDFAAQAALVGPTTVYACASGAIADDAAVALYSYDESAKCFVAEDAQAYMSGGYACFTVSEGKTYVESARALPSEAAEVLTGSGSSTTSASCCESDTAVTSLPAPLCALLVVLIAGIAGVAWFVSRRREKVSGAVVGAAPDMAPSVTPSAALDTVPSMTSGTKSDAALDTVPSVTPGAMPDVVCDATPDTSTTHIHKTEEDQA